MKVVSVDLGSLTFRIFIHGFGQYLFKSSDFDCFEELVDRTKELINSFGVIGIAEIERMQPEE